MADVVDFGERRRARGARMAAARQAVDDGPLTCHCGSVWWEVAVTIERGRIAGRTAEVECRDCGQRHSVAWNSDT